ncbi:hypothetical protein C8F04DRAFT_1259932 [Mycena alexandri]|uniref:F-box domain-containing protein n=1 Tax=Mycena alexandri TaxID=1745969 RepID=A0AAD6SVZ4_9AGAR|nr:hypothetical protein C8F04DRAFT_1259932 [Mycena alexandri]
MASIARATRIAELICAFAAVVFAGLDDVPNEIWSLIFSFVWMVESPGSRKFAHARGRMARVCRKWCQIAYAVPGIWRALSVDRFTTRDAVQAFVLHSAAQRVCLGFSHPESSLNPRAPAGLNSLLIAATTLGDVAYRWDALEVKTVNTSTLESMLSLLRTLKSPGIRRLCLTREGPQIALSGENMYHELPSILGGVFSSLQTAELNGVPLSWATLSTAFCMRRLSISNLPPSSWPTCADYMCMLLASPVLQELELVNVGCSTSPSTRGVLTSVPSLTSIRLYFAQQNVRQSESLCSFLSTLLFPALDVLDITFSLAVLTLCLSGLHFRPRELILAVALGANVDVPLLLSSFSSVVTVDLRRCPPSFIRALGNPRTGTSSGGCNTRFEGV